MKTLLPEINSADNRFHAGNPATGEQGTRVTDTWLNDVQDRVRDVQAEAHYVLQKAGFTPKAETQTQLYQAIVKIIDDNRKSASTTQKGEVRLTSDTGLDSEELGLTAKAGKKLAQLIATVQLALNNYIPLNKRSSAVNSNDENNVATSKAVKTAYDKGVEAKNAADNANNNANGRISKSGDTMTGILNLNREDALLRWQRNGVNKFAVGFRNTISEDLLLYNYAFNTEFALREHDLYCNKQLNLPGALFENGDYAGFDIKNSSARYVRVEGNSHGSGNMLSFVYRESNGSNINVAYLPRKNGNILLDADFTYQKIGDFEVRKYPDGTMIQSCRINIPITNRTTIARTLNWALAFADADLRMSTTIIYKETNESYRPQALQGNIDPANATASVIQESASEFTLVIYDPDVNNAAFFVDIIAIGRWK